MKKGEYTVSENVMPNVTKCHKQWAGSETGLTVATGSVSQQYHHWTSKHIWNPKSEDGFINKVYQHKQNILKD